jgi:hypothetical protein
VTVLSPLFLLQGLGAAIPIVLHLLRRRIGVRIDFPALRYLLRAEQENRRTMRLRNLLLMLVRVVAVLLLSIAAARPIGRWMGAGHAPAAIVLLIDNTMSSGVVIDGRSVLDRFKSAASDVLATTTAGDRAWLVTADGGVAGGTIGSVRDAIARLTPSSADADLPAALRRAEGLAHSASETGRVVLVFTDGQRTSWPSGVQATDARTVIWMPQLQSPQNHAVSYAAAKPMRWSPRGEVALKIDGRDSLTYRVTIAGRTLARGNAAPNVETTIHASPAERGWVGGSVDVAPDELAADDIRYFAAWIGPAPAVYATPNAGEFVNAALDALRGSSRITNGRAIAVGPADEITALPALITPPADAVKLGAANRALERLGIPWRFGVRRTQNVDANSKDLGSIPLTERYELVAQAGASADTLAAVGQAPWIIGGPKYVLVGSPLVATATALPIRAAFLPWLATVLTERLSGEPGTVTLAAPAAWLRRPTGVDQLEQPDGSMVAIGDSVRVPANAGVYFFVAAGHRNGALVVNPPPRESILDHMTADDMRKLVGGAQVIAATDPSTLRTASFRAATTRSLLVPFLVAVLIALLVETMLVAAPRREAA